MCVSCGCGNPAQASRCVTCESRLQPAVCVGSSAPSGRMLSCSRCKRLNRSDARFCDWCGSKGHAVSCVLCWRCGASAPPNASYCPACSTFLQAPPPRTSRSDITTPVEGFKAKQASAPTSHDATLLSKGPAPRKKMAPPTAECSTQTVGLYYPSATELQRKEQQREKRSKTNAERQPASAVSPGRGEDYKTTELQNYRTTKLQNYKTTELQDYKTTELQNYKTTELQNYKTTRLQNYRTTKLQNYRTT
ncbi:double zinc ribbon and ankyrin repeat-containing protein 1 [Notothenia coriiceps]|uniref:Double zinc ribbon and ankyrin repeat-containing protein 1 n=1 Tax=Notothenia coriiceps TaxID=8208 RepID=A0A6I9MWP5_9TELE|nr:PREDICTED: double zinc ribbon and ankyrin repeat-containing protein 1 [Notothenia coriiceps]